MVAQRDITPDYEEDDPEEPQKPTPKRTQVRILTKFCQDMYIKINQPEIFQYCNIRERTGWRLIGPGQEARRLQNSTQSIDPRGRKLLISKEDFEKMEDWLIEGGFNHRVCSWVELFNEVFPDRQLDERTIRRAFYKRGYYKCIACQKPSLTEKSLLERQQYLTERRFWTLRQWRRVRFSDKCHFGIGPQRKLRVIRRQGERYHPDCIQKTFSAKKAKFKNSKRFHVWAAIGYGFKSELIFYETSSTNGKMTSRVYKDQIINRPVKQWIERGDDFILEEDQDSAHGVADNNNEVHRAKESSDLSTSSMLQALQI